MSDVKAPTCEEVYEDDDLVLVDEASGPWRHGNYVTAVYLRRADATYWKARYHRSTDGETHELRDGSASISRCWPYAKTVTAYSDTPL
jgi:hypothetical protein